MPGSKIGIRYSLARAAKQNDDSRSGDYVGCQR